MGQWLRRRSQYIELPGLQRCPKRYELQAPWLRSVQLPTSPVSKLDTRPRNHVRHKRWYHHQHQRRAQIQPSILRTFPILCSIVLAANHIAPCSRTCTQRHLLSTFPPGSHKTPLLSSESISIQKKSKQSEKQNLSCANVILLFEKASQAEASGHA